MVNEELMAEVVAKTFEKASVFPSKDGLGVLKQAYEAENHVAAKGALQAILENLELAEKGYKSMCQTFATPAVHINLGTKVNLNGINVEGAVREGCRIVTGRSFMRPSVVDPISRKQLGGMLVDIFRIFR